MSTRTTSEMLNSVRRIAIASRLFLAIAVISLCAAIALLAYHQGAFTRTLAVFFYAGTADGMHKGMAVKLVGFKVGYLDEIVIDNDLRVKVTIRIDRKYTPMIDMGATVRLAREGGQVLLAVEDNGPGIAAADRERVFERFHRLAPSTIEGTGLGLAIVKEIVAAHDGAILLMETQPPPGLRVEVRLPAAAPEPPPG